MNLSRGLRLLFALMLVSEGAVAQTARSVSLAEGEVGLVRTSVGYSTVLEFEQAVRQVVVGDQDAFKIEFSGAMVALKPTIRAAATNLFVTVDGRTFVFRVIPAPGGNPDYVVRVRGGAAGREADGWLGIGSDISSDGLRLRVSGARQLSGSGQVEIAFELDLARSRGPSAGPLPEIDFEPGDVSVRIGGRDQAIDHLYLDRLSLGFGPPVRGLAIIPGQIEINPSAVEVQFAPGKKRVAAKIRKKGAR